MNKAKLILFSIICWTYPNCMPPGGGPPGESEWEIQRYFSSYFTFNNAKINFIKMGSGEPVVLVHGGGSWSYSFRNNIIPLSKHFTVYTIDIPGHGYSEIPDGYEYTLESVNRVLLAFFAHSGISAASIVGNSWGGGWAIYFAERNPDRVRSLILIDSSGLTESNEYDGSLWKYLSLPGGGLILHFVTKNNVRDGYENDLFFDKHLVTDEMVNEIYAPLHYRDNLIAQQKYQIHLDWKETGPGLILLRNVVLIWGRHDRYLPVSMLNKYRELIPRAETHIMEASRHLPHEEEYAAVNRIIIEALEAKK